MNITINLDSIGSLVGSVITLTFTIYFFTSYLVVKKERLFICLAGFMFTLCVYLTGYVIYSSSLNPRSVLFWTRVCFSGASMITYSAVKLSSEIIHKESRFLNLSVMFLVVGLLVLIFIPTEWLFTAELNPSKTHSSVIKGPLFPVFLGIILLIDLMVLIRFITGLFRKNESLYQITPLLFGLVFWFLEAVIDGVFGAVLSMINIKLSLGPIIMTFSLALYSGRTVERKNKELIKIKEENRQIYNSLIYDKLSALYSRQYFLETLEQRSALIKRENVTDCLMFLDVDNFKCINDELGHIYGDEVISLTGEILRRYSRKSDVCARYGGDEFVILLENCDSQASLEIADTIKSNFKKELSEILGNWSGCRKISLSIGIICSNNWTEDIQDNIRKADSAMYEAKHLGKDKAVIFHE